MNAKKAKTLRRVLREFVDVREAEYQETNRRTKQAYRVDGVVIGEVPTSTLVLAPGCGRGLYQSLKKEAA